MIHDDDENLTLHKHLGHLAFLDQCAWKSFKKIKVEKGPNPYNFRRALQVFKASKKFRISNFLEFYLFWLVIAHLTAIVIFLPNPGIWRYICIPVFLISTARLFATWENFRTEYYFYAARDENPLQYAFGTENATLFVKTFEENFRNTIKDEKSIEYISLVKVKDFDALIKLNKAAQDKDEVNLGIGETVKKATYGALLLAIVKLDFSGFGKTFESYSNYAAGLDTSKIDALDIFYFSIMMISGIFFIYDLFVGQTRAKRQKKNYLLMLNIAKESWVEISDKIEEKPSTIALDRKGELWDVALEEIEKTNGVARILKSAIFAWLLSDKHSKN